MEYRVGDRVIARTSGFVPALTRGTVEQVLHFVSRMYYVRFDGVEALKLMHGRDLQLVIDNPPPQSKP